MNQHKKLLIIPIILILSCSSLMGKNYSIESTSIKPNTPTNTISSTNTFTLSATRSITPRKSSTPMCKLRINGQYTWKSINIDLYIGPGLTLFYNEGGGGKYGNDQVGCELNWDCSLLRAHNKDSSDPNTKGVDGPWVNALTGSSIAQFKEWGFKCRLSKIQ